MTFAVGSLLGAGLLLMVSPWMWPRHSSPAGRARPLDPLRDRLRHAGLAQLPVAVPIVVSALIGLGCGAVVLMLVPVTALALAGTAVGAALPLAIVEARARSQRRAIRAAWPDLVDHLVAGIRSGQPLAESVGALAQVGPPATRAAFRDFERIALGSGNFSTALDALKVALADPVADRIVETLRLAREVGGSELPSVLRALAAGLRQDAAARAEVEARQSWIRGAARLGVVAPWVVLMLLSARSEAASAYNTPAGLAVLGVGLALTVLAYRTMVVIGRLPEERRWFA